MLNVSTTKIFAVKNSNDQKAMWNTVYNIVDPDKKKLIPQRN